MTAFRFVFMRGLGRVYVQAFAAPDWDETFAGVGSLTMRPREWDDLMTLLTASAQRVDFRDETPKVAA